MKHHEGRLAGKVAIVTGASRGIGQAIASAMAREGASVVLAARKPEELLAARDAIVADGGTAEAVACHVGKDEDRARLVATAVERFGKVDVLVNNAATSPYLGPLVDVDWGAWEKTFEVNVKAPFALARDVIRNLRSRGAPGSIISVASVLGTIAAPNQGVYGMSKAAVLSMTKTLALELGGTGVRVNAIAPGFVATKMVKRFVEDDAMIGPILARTAVGRVAAPEEIAGGAVYLASDESTYVTGQTLFIDGGWTVS